MATHDADRESTRSARRAVERPRFDPLTLLGVALVAVLVLLVVTPCFAWC
jgi:hypothetical protein